MYKEERQALKLLNTKCSDCNNCPAPNYKFKRSFCDSCFKKRWDSVHKSLENLASRIRKTRGSEKQELIIVYNNNVKSLYGIE